MSNTPQADTFVSVPNSLLASTQDILTNVERRIKLQRDDICALIENNTRLMLAVLERDREIRELRAENGRLKHLETA